MKQEFRQEENIFSMVEYLSINNLHTITSFLDSQTIQIIVKALPNVQKKENRFLNVVKIQHFISNYLIKTDRSMHMSFYGQQDFIRVQKEQLRVLFNQSSNALLFLSSNYNSLFSSFQKELSLFEHSDDFISIITEALVDPELPFPKLRKQSIGMHCHSSFQFYLIDKLQEVLGDEDLQETLECLKQHIYGLEIAENYILQYGQIYKFVQREWFKITYENYKDYLINGDLGHNLIVLLVAFIDLFVDTINIYVESIKDPLHCFAQFNVRYCIFRNSILSLEEKIGFLFKRYAAFFDDSFGEKQPVRQMTLWHVALSKWYFHMQPHDSQFFKTFFYILRKVNFQAMKAELQVHQGQQGPFIELINRLQLNDIDFLEREECFEFYSPLQEYFEEDINLNKQIIQQFMEYKIDISINQYTVHWCGSSKHDLHLPYKNFQGQFMLEFDKYLGKIVKIAKSTAHSKETLDYSFSVLISQLDTDFVKPVTLTKVIQKMKEIINLQMGSFSKTSQTMKKIQAIELFCAGEDKKIQIFNSECKIINQSKTKYSIIVDNQDFTRMLKYSSSTAASKMSNFNKYTSHLSLESSSSIEASEFP